MEQEWWPLNGDGPSRDDDRFLLLLSLGVGVLAAFGMVLYLALN
jgi:hypothetical protein